MNYKQCLENDNLELCKPGSKWSNKPNDNEYKT